MTDKHEFKALNDFRLSRDGLFTALKFGDSSVTEPRNYILSVYNTETGRMLMDHRETSIIHTEWHPVMNRLLFIGYRSGLNCIDFTPEEKKKLITGVVEQSTLFLEYFHFSPKGKSAGYMFRNVLQIPESAEKEEQRIRDIILDEEKTQVLFYEKADLTGKIEGLGRAWNWIDEDRLIHCYQDDIFITDVVWNSRKKIGNLDKFILDFSPWKKGILVTAIDYQRLMDTGGEFSAFLFEENGEQTTLDISPGFIPEIIPAGDYLIYNRKGEGEEYRIARYDSAEKKETLLTPEGDTCKMPRIAGNRIFHTFEKEDSIAVMSMDMDGNHRREHFKVELPEERAGE